MAATSWACPNTPPCPHLAFVHDIEDFEDPAPRCCADGCSCGKRIHYWMLLSEDLIGARPTWEEAGLRLTKLGEVEEPGARWCLFEDPAAPEDLEGQRVEVIFQRAEDGSLRVLERRLA